MVDVATSSEGKLSTETWLSVVPTATSRESGEMAVSFFAREREVLGLCEY